jgi:hypothetical protein
MTQSLPHGWDSVTPMQNEAGLGIASPPGLVIRRRDE